MIACLDDTDPVDTLEADLALSLTVLALCRWMAGR